MHPSDYFVGTHLKYTTMNTDNMISVNCRNCNVTKSYPAGTTLMDIYNDLKPQMKYGPLAARANNKTKNLAFRIYKPKVVDFIGLECESGRRVYARSLSFVLYKAIREVMTGVRLRVELTVANGFYCRLLNSDRKPVLIDQKVIDQLKQNMRKTVESNLPFVMETLPTSEAIKIFTADGAADEVNLLSSLGQLYCQVYRLGDLYDYYAGALVPSTGYVDKFDLIKYKDGLLLFMPEVDDATKVSKYEPQEKLFDAYNEHVKWNELIGLSNIGDLNRIVKSSKDPSMLIAVSEALQDKKIANIADTICSDPRRRVVLIAGPSSSGKTTFSKKLSIHLTINGKKPIPFSLDDYFVDRDKTPKDENGEYDFESLYALDLDLFNRHLNQILNGEEVELPYYNFETGKREYRGNKIKLGDGGILVIEGIHGLNPELTAQVPAESKFKIYASALTTISLDDHNWIPTTDNRLLRRIVRDYNYRSYSAEDTINRWASVHKGEEKWIYPFRSQADMMFNSALIFELAVLKRYAEPILNMVPQQSMAYSEAHRLLKFLQFIIPIPDANIPKTSLLREFFGGSSFKY